MNGARYSAVVISRETFVREMIVEALAGAEVTVLGSGRFLDEKLISASPTPPDLILYVDAGHSARNSERDAEKISALAPTKWLILCNSADNPVFARLRELKLQVSAAPLDISREDLTFLARLASRGRRVFIDGFCEINTTDRLEALRRMDLDADHWLLLRYLSAGLSNKAIANLKGTNEAAIKAQIRTLLNKISAENRTQAAVIAARAGLTYEPAADPAGQETDRGKLCVLNDVRAQPVGEEQARRRA